MLLLFWGIRCWFLGCGLKESAGLLLVFGLASRVQILIVVRGLGFKA